MFLFIILVAGVIGFIIYNYNTTQGHAQEVMQSHSNVMVSMKKRVDLVNKLMDITMSYGEHEKLTHISVKQSDHSNLAYANSKVEGALMEINSIARDFPDLKANQTYQQLMQDLNRIEDGLQEKREHYNDSVKIYNKSITSIPFVFFASKLGFKPAKYFDVDSSDNLENIKDFNTNDGEALKEVMKKITDNTKTIAQEAAKSGKEIINNRISKKENGQKKVTPENPVVSQPNRGTTGLNTL